jgi:metacaspase-1
LHVISYSYPRIGYVIQGAELYGAFTYYFCKTLRDVQGAITRAELLKLMRASLKHEGYDQIPQLECPAAAKKKKLLE